MSEPQTIHFKFSGNGGEYFRIWIVNSILTILTLGIYSAWAKVRTNRYFYGNTVLDNATFEYHATPIMILKGRLIAVAALIIYVAISKVSPIAGLAFIPILGLLAPWVIWRSIQFNARMVSYRNIRFHFHGALKEVYKILVLIPLLPIIVGGILVGISLLIDKEGKFTVILSFMVVIAFYAVFPYIQQLMTSYYINNRQYGQGQFSAQLSAEKYYKIYLTLIGLTVLVSLIIGMLIAFILGVTGEFDKITAMMQSSEDPEEVPIALVGAILFVYIAFGILSIWGTAYIQTNIKNYVLNRTSLDNIQINSSIEVGKLFVIYFTNILLLMATFGLAYPWTIIRLKKYKLESTSVTGNINEYVNQQQQKQSALGEELGDAFDMDLDLGM